MKLHLLTCDEFFLLKTFKEESLTRDSISHEWNTKDYIVFIVEKKPAALLQISNILDQKAEIHFLHIIDENDRPLLLGENREKLLNNTALFLDFFDQFHNNLYMYFNDIDYLYDEALKAKQKKLKEEKESEITRKLLYLEEDKPKSDSVHSKTQHLLKKLAKVTGCDVWMASNDQNRDYHGYRLGEDTLETFPNFNIEEEAKKRIALIDTLWFKEDQPLCAFEAEITSSVYSGILRMADLITVIPNLKLKLYIVAPMERKEKVLKELSRPLFKQIGLSDYCKFVPLENLEILYQKVKGLDGYVSYDVVDAISLTIEKDIFAH